MNLLVIDNIASFASDYNDQIEKANALKAVAGYLKCLAHDYNVAVVVVNNMVDKI